MTNDATGSPVISVVMAVYNGHDVLGRTLESLETEECDGVEIIVIDDGSTDDTASILDHWQVVAPNRRVLHQSNQGLTASLIAGCRMAHGRYIARQDAGDLSFPGRLSRLREVLDKDTEVVMVSSGVRFVDQDGDLLYEEVMAGDAAMSGLRAREASALRGPPHHGSVMFRAETYRDAGEYRAEFFVAQDLDLWTRLAERGRHVSLGDILYQADASPGAISFTRPEVQRAATALILEAGHCRLRGESELRVLEEARRVTRRAPASPARSRSAYHYFIAGCLRDSRPDKALRNYRHAIRSYPLNWRAWIRWIQTAFGGLNRPSGAK